MTHFPSTRNTVSRPSTSSARPSTTSQSSNSSLRIIGQKIKRSMDASAEDYWTRPHVFYSPRPSMQSNRTSGSTGSTSSIKSVAQSVKRTLNAGTEEYWSRPHPLAPSAPISATPVTPAQRQSIDSQRSSESISSIKSAAISLKETLNSGTDSYWSRPHPLSPNPGSETRSSASSSSSSKTSRGLLKGLKSEVDRGTEEYRSQQEARAVYFALRA